MRKILILLLALFVPVILFSLGFLLHSLSQSERVMQEQTENTVKSAVQQLNEELSSTNYYLSSLLVSNPDVQKAASEGDVIEVNNALRSLQTTLSSQSEYLVRKYNYMYYNPDKELSIWKLDSITPYKENVKMKEKLLQKIREGTLAANAQTWSYEFLEGELFLLQAYHNANGYMFCWMPASTAFSFLKDMLTRDRGFYTLISRDGTALLAGDRMREFGVSLGEGGTVSAEQDVHCASYDLARLNLKLLVVTSKLIDTGSLSTLVAFILLIAAFLLCFSLYTIYYFSHYIARPFEQFRQHIGSYSEQLRPEKRRGFAELNEAVSAFDSLTQQLEQLKIRIYEERLALAKTELEYFQQQIKPHFFINCFGIIFKMSQNEEFETIQQFCMSLSNYVRYLFRDGFTMVTLEKELELTKEYLQIQNVRYHAQLFLAETIPENLLRASLPPLLILTFVENSVKHAVNKQDLGVAIEAEAEGGMLTLRILDNGPGIAPEKLRQLNGETVPGRQWNAGAEEGASIGIRNIAKRLNLIYGTDYELRFSGLPEDCGHSGTCVTVRLPNKASAAPPAGPSEGPPR